MTKQMPRPIHELTSAMGDVLLIGFTPFDESVCQEIGYRSIAGRVLTSRANEPELLPGIQATSFIEIDFSVDRARALNRAGQVAYSTKSLSLYRTVRLMATTLAEDIGAEDAVAQIRRTLEDTPMAESIQGHVETALDGFRGVLGEAIASGHSVERQIKDMQAIIRETDDRLAAIDATARASDQAAAA